MLLYPKMTPCEWAEFVADGRKSAIADYLHFGGYLLERLDGPELLVHVEYVDEIRENYQGCTLVIFDAEDAREMFAADHDLGKVFLALMDEEEQLPRMIFLPADEATRARKEENNENL